MTFYRSWGKRSLDVIGSCLVLLVFAPAIFLVAILVKWRLGDPIFFRQRRPGISGEPFEMIKFRTMKNSMGPDGRLLPDDRRLTKFGRKLREWSLDELPTFWNVLRGDMSLVGPRPLLTQYLPLYSKHQARRHELRPGITGLAQVSGRNAITWEDKFERDIYYVDNCSFKLDATIICKTIAKVISREGVNFNNPGSMPFFQGSKNASEAEDNAVSTESDQ